MTFQPITFSMKSISFENIPTFENRFHCYSKGSSDVASPIKIHKCNKVILSFKYIISHWKYKSFLLSTLLFCVCIKFLHKIFSLKIFLILSWWKRQFFFNFKVLDLYKENATLSGSLIFKSPHHGVPINTDVIFVQTPKEISIFIVIFCSRQTQREKNVAEKLFH